MLRDKISVYTRNINLVESQFLRREFNLILTEINEKNTDIIKKTKVCMLATTKPSELEEFLINAEPASLVIFLFGYTSIFSKSPSSFTILISWPFISNSVLFLIYVLRPHHQQLPFVDPNAKSYHRYDEVRYRNESFFLFHYYNHLCYPAIV